ncbi:hypothetical protein [Collimonas arenae]|uniref:hypothetical protein n=1 Tax=Collimonas arenae TaxID=279058 RepID=UPI000B27840C|nr:hypothetical protein [Collimonas arenae]
MKILSREPQLRIKSRLVTLTLQLFFSAIPFLQYTGAAHAFTLENPSALKGEVDRQNPSSSRWEPPYPFTPEELEQELILILQIPANDLSKEKIEAIFDMKFHNSGTLPDSIRNRPDRDRWYMRHSKSGVDWFFATGISIAPQRTNFLFTWWSPESTPEPYVVPMCIDTRKILKDIEALNVGWKEEVSGPLWVSPHGINPRHSFARGKNESLSVDYLPGTTCMTAFAFNVRTTNGDSTQ